MGSATGSRPCTHTRYWEYGIKDYTPSDKKIVTERHSVQTRQDWKYFSAQNEWALYGSLIIPDSVLSAGSTLYYVSGTFSSTGNPPQPVGGGTNGQIQSTYGSGSADYKGEKELGKQPIYGWFEPQSGIHTHQPNISDGEGHTLYLTGCTASAPVKSGTGSNGQTATTTDNGTASYEGSWTDPDPDPGKRPQNWNWSTLTNTIHFSSTYMDGGLRKGNFVSAAEWNAFCIRINDFRRYKLGTGKDASFSTLVSKQPFRDVFYKQAVNAISAMATVNQSGGYYTKLSNLRAALNSIT